MTKLRLGALGNRLVLTAALALASVPTTAQEASFRLSFLPREATNLVCFSREHALDLLAEFREVYMAEARPRVKRLVRSFADKIGPGKQYDCALLKSVYIPIMPIDAIDLVSERSLDWGDKDEHYFVTSKVLVGEKTYTKTADGGPIFAFTSDFVIIKE